MPVTVDQAATYRHSEEWLRLLESIVTQVNESVIITESLPLDGSGPRIVYVNRAFTATTGYSREDALGKTPRILQGPETDKWALAQIRAALSEQKSTVVELNNYRKDGTQFYVELSIAPVTDQDGRCTHYIAIQRDITSLKQKEAGRLALEQSRQVEAKMREMEKLNLLKDEFLSTVSHELRAPIANMKLALRMLKTTGDRQKREDYLRILESECEREGSIIDDLLDLQKLEAKTKQVAPERIALSSWMQALVQPFILRGQQRQQNLTLVVGNPDVICTDRLLLERLLTELINNACKYTPPGETIAIEVAPAYDSRPTIELSVCNHGIEIPAHELPRLFEKFYRVPGGDPWKQGGTGLGLALVKQLVERLEGSVSVQSKFGKTTFRVVLPQQCSALMCEPETAL